MVASAGNLTEPGGAGNGGNTSQHPRYKSRLMSDAPESKPPEPEPKPDDAPNKGDVIALGIGCVVVLIFLVAIILVGVSRE